MRQHDNTLELLHAINQLGSRVQRFKKKGKNTWNFRCPICGDSDRSKTKARGNIYQNSKGGFSFKCFNCGEGLSVQQFLKENYKDLYDEYRLAIFKDRTQTFTPKQMYVPDTAFDNTLLTPAEESLEARIYLNSRSISKEHWKHFFYCDKIGSFIRANRNDGHYEDIRDDGKWLVAPVKSWIASSGREVVQAVCCRAIDETSKIRYKNAKFRDDCLHDQVIWGLDHVDKTRPIIAVEGIFDALFIDNAIAMMTSVKVLRGYDTSTVIYVLDNEPRNKDIVKIAERHALAGRTISLLPDKYLKYGKDINDYVKNNVDVQTIKNDILLHSYNGPRAILEIQRWRKI